MIMTCPKSNDHPYDPAHCPSTNPPIHQSNVGVCSITACLFMQTTRRQFLKLSVGFGAGVGVAMPLSSPRSLGAEAAAANPIPVGFQLYTLRCEFQRDV